MIPFVVESEIVEETSTITGTGNYVLNGPTAGYFAFVDAYVDGDDFKYRATDGPNVEIADGTYDASANSIVRGTIIASSNSDDVVNWSGGTRQIIRPVDVLT